MRFIKPLIALFSVLVEAGCSSVKVYNHEACADLGPYGAHCANTLNDKTRNIAKPAWDKERVGMLCMSSQAFTDIETTIDVFCATYSWVCDYRTREELSANFAKVNSLIAAQKKLVGPKKSK